MPSHVWTVFCRRSITDRDSNQISLIDSIESISLNGSPVTGSSQTTFEIDAELVSFWVREKPALSETGRYRVCLFDPSGHSISDPVEVAIDLEDRKRSRTVVRIPTLPLCSEGEYTFVNELEVDGGWLEVAKVPYELFLEAAQPEDTLRKPARRKRPTPSP